MIILTTAIYIRLVMPAVELEGKVWMWLVSAILDAIVFVAFIRIVVGSLNV